MSKTAKPIFTKYPRKMAWAAIEVMNSVSELFRG